MSGTADVLRRRMGIGPARESAGQPWRLLRAAWRVLDTYWNRQGHDDDTRALAHPST